MKMFNKEKMLYCQNMNLTVTVLLEQRLEEGQFFIKLVEERITNSNCLISPNSLGFWVSPVPGSELLLSTVSGLVHPWLQCWV